MPSYRREIAAVLAEYHRSDMSDAERAESDRFYLEAIGSSWEELDARLTAVADPAQVAHELAMLAEVCTRYGMEAGRIPHAGTFPPDTVET